MRRAHFVMIFAIAFLANIMSVANNQFRNRIVIDERARLEDAFLSAADSAAEELALGFRTDLTSTLSNISELFFHTLSAGLAGFGDEDTELELALYVPVLAVTMEDGFYLCVLERADIGGETLLVRRWTECMPYAFEDSSYVYRFLTTGPVMVYDKRMKKTYELTLEQVQNDPVLSAQFASSQVFASEENFKTYRQAAIVNSIEKRVTLALNRQAYLAGDFGCNISYACPSFLDVLPEGAAGAFVAVYQGLPSRVKTSYTYSGVKSASFIKEKQLYYVAEPEGGAYYRLAHREGCAHLTGSERERIDRETAIHVYGAYGCPDCILPVEGFMSPP